MSTNLTFTPAPPSTSQTSSSSSSPSTGPGGAGARKPRTRHHSMGLPQRSVNNNQQNDSVTPTTTLHHAASTTITSTRSANNSSLSPDFQSNYNNHQQQRRRSSSTSVSPHRDAEQRNQQQRRGSQHHQRTASANMNDTASPPSSIASLSTAFLGGGGATPTSRGESPSPSPSGNLQQLQPTTTSSNIHNPNRRRSSVANRGEFLLGEGAASKLLKHAREISSDKFPSPENSTGGELLSGSGDNDNSDENASGNFETPSSSAALTNTVTLVPTTFQAFPEATYRVGEYKFPIEEEEEEEEQDEENSLVNKLAKTGYSSFRKKGGRHGIKQHAGGGLSPAAFAFPDELDESALEQLAEDMHSSSSSSSLCSIENAELMETGDNFGEMKQDEKEQNDGEENELQKKFVRKQTTTPSNAIRTTSPTSSTAAAEGGRHLATSPTIALIGHSKETKARPLAPAPLMEEFLEDQMQQQKQKQQEAEQGGGMLDVSPTWTNSNDMESLANKAATTSSSSSSSSASRPSVATGEMSAFKRHQLEKAKARANSLLASKNNTAATTTTPVPAPPGTTTTTSSTTTTTTITTNTTTTNTTTTSSSSGGGLLLRKRSLRGLSVAISAVSSTPQEEVEEDWSAPTVTSGGAAGGNVAWPEFSERLAATIQHDSTVSQQGRFVDVLATTSSSSSGKKNRKNKSSPASSGSFSPSSSMTAAASGALHHSRHARGIAPSQLQEDEDEDDECESPSSSSSPKRGAKNLASSINNELNEDDEEIIEMAEAAPTISKTHISPHRKYYFQQKKVLDSNSGSLEDHSPAMISSAVRAMQSAFEPWCSYHNDRLIAGEHSNYATEIGKMMAEADMMSGATSVSSAVAATPLAFNSGWRPAGICKDPISDDIVVNPSVAVPSKIMQRTDASKNPGASTSHRIRGKLIFERGQQTVLTLFHETTMFSTVCRLQMCQREQIVRAGLMTERAHDMFHITTLEEHERQLIEWQNKVLKKHPTNQLSLCRGAIRELKGEREMIKNLLLVPTANGIELKDILQPEQKEKFDSALDLSASMISTWEEHFIVPLLNLVRLEETVRRQEVSCYEGWVSSMEHLSALIRMAYVRRASGKVRHALRTSTELDSIINNVKNKMESRG